MSIIPTADFQFYAGLDPSQRMLLYGPLVLEYAMIQSCELTKEEPESHSTVILDDLQSDFGAFQILINKLAQACDNERGGKSVSAITVLQGATGPEFVLAANKKDKAGTRTTEIFLNKLLHLAGHNPGNLNQSALEKRVLWMMLAFALPRIVEYRSELEVYLKLCIEDVRRRQPEDSNAEDDKTDDGKTNDGDTDDGK